MNASAKQELPTPGYIPRWTFGDRARRVRRDMGLSQQQMADALRVGLKAYSAWESGKNVPNLTDIAVRFERVSGVPRAWFLGWADENGPTSEETGPMNVRPPGLEPGTHWLRVSRRAHAARGPRNRTGKTAPGRREK